MKRALLLIVASAMLAALGFAQSPATSVNTDQTSVKGCLGGSVGTYTVVEDKTGHIFKITTSSVDLKPHLGHDVALIGHRASGESSAAADNNFAVTELNMISEHCATVAAATVSAPAETAATPPVASATAPAATTSTVAETAITPATASTPAAETAIAPAPASTPPADTAVSPAAASTAPVSAIPAAPAATVTTPSEAVSAPPPADASPVAETATTPVAAAAPAAATVTTPEEAASTPAARPRRPSATAAAASTKPAVTASKSSEEPVSKPPAVATTPETAASTSSEPVSTPAAVATTSTPPTTRRGSLWLLMLFVVLVLVIGILTPSLNRWRKRKSLARTGAPNLSLTREASSDHDKTDPQVPRKAA
jgi:hypothetical protein